MKRLLAILALVLLAAAAFGLDLSVGVGADYQPIFETLTLAPMKAKMSYQTLGAGAFFDATYGLLGVQYVFSIADPKISLYVNDVKDTAASESATADAKGTKVSYLDLILLGKYPFQLGAVTLAPAVGLNYMLNLAVKQDGTDLKADLSTNDKNSLNDFYIVGGLIVSFAIGKSFFVSIDGLFGWNLTPNWMPDLFASLMGPGVKYSAWKIKAGLSAGYKIASF
jgi:hypothetical protein